MFPDIVKLDELDPKTLSIGAGYAVGAVSAKRKDGDGLTRAGEWVGKFEGLNTLFSYMAGEMPEARHSKSSDRSSDAGGAFHFYPNYQTALNTYLYHPGEVCEFTQSDVMLEGGESSGKELVFDVTGDVLDVGRYLDSEPECFGSLTNGNPRNRRVNIVMNASWSWRVDKEVINTRSKRLLRLVDWLESQGIRTQVLLMTSSECEHLELIVKRFDEPLNLNDVAIVAHSDFLRRIIFRIDEYSKTYQSSYGSSINLSSYLIRHPERFESGYNGEYTVLMDVMNDTGVDEMNKKFDTLEARLETGLPGDDLKPVLKL